MFPLNYKKRRVFETYWLIAYLNLISEVNSSFNSSFQVKIPQGKNNSFINSEKKLNLLS